ncbi:MAG: ABC transporter permease subunit [Lachnospiraceae bacterium]|nr:ABC transporter permease subunit [Lachnospiraceae bacterium]
MGSRRKKNTNLYWKQVFQAPKTRIGFVIVILFALAAIFAPVLAPHDPLYVDVSIKLQGPSLAYPLGTDQLGRCILSRLLWGSRYSLSYSFAVLLITVAVGVPIGLFAGYVGGKIDSVIMRVIDVFMAMPMFIVALAIAGTMGASGAHLILSLSVVSWAEYARLARALTLQEKNQNYMTALKAGGCGHARIIFKHILRNILPSIIALASMEIGSIILSIAGFSFIGLGVQAPTPEWGIMLSDSKSYIQTYPSLMFYPGILIMLIVLAFNYLGEGIQNGTAKR